MSAIDWKEKLNWNEENLEDLRYTGFSYVRQGKYDIALAFFEALEILDPTSAYDAQTLGAIYLQLHQYAKALKQLERALKHEKEDKAPILLNLAKTLFAMKKKEEGLKVASMLKNDKNSQVASVAKALLLAYGS